MHDSRATELVTTIGAPIIGARHTHLVERVARRHLMELARAPIVGRLLSIVTVRLLIELLLLLLLLGIRHDLMAVRLLLVVIMVIAGRLGRVLVGRLDWRRVERLLLAVAVHVRRLLLERRLRLVMMVVAGCCRDRIVLLDHVVSSSFCFATSNLFAIASASALLRCELAARRSETDIGGQLAAAMSSDHCDVWLSCVSLRRYRTICRASLRQLN